MISAVPDYIAEAAAFRARRPAIRLVDRGMIWKIIDTGPGQTGETLLLCPGTLGNADIFRNIIEALAPDLRVVSMTYPFISDAIRISEGAVSLLSRLGVDEAHVLGSSLGGIVTQAIANRHPGRTRHVFVANSLATVDTIRALLPPVNIVRQTPPSALKAIVLNNMTEWPEPAPEFSAIKAYLSNELATRLTGRAFKARALALASLEDIPVARVSVDRLTIIQAQDDPLIAPPVRQSVVDRYPGAHVHTFETGGHFPYITRASAHVRLIRHRLGF